MTVAAVALVVATLVDPGVAHAQADAIHARYAVGLAHVEFVTAEAPPRTLAMNVFYPAQPP